MTIQQGILADPTAGGLTGAFLRDEVDTAPTPRTRASTG